MSVREVLLSKQLIISDKHRHFSVRYAVYRSNCLRTYNEMSLWQNKDDLI